MPLLRVNDHLPAEKHSFDDDAVKNAPHALIAEARTQMIQEYVGSGRHLKRSSEEALAGAWVNLMRAWAAARQMVIDHRRRAFEAEYALRSQKPPYERAAQEIVTIARTAAD
jgi:hypothetical protein